MEPWRAADAQNGAVETRESVDQLVANSHHLKRIWIRIRIKEMGSANLKVNVTNAKGWNYLAAMVWQKHISSRNPTQLNRNAVMEKQIS